MKAGFTAVPRCPNVMALQGAASQKKSNNKINHGHIRSFVQFFHEGTQRCVCSTREEQGGEVGLGKSKGKENAPRKGRACQLFALTPFPLGVLAQKHFCVVFSSPLAFTWLNCKRVFFFVLFHFSKLIVVEPMFCLCFRALAISRFVYLPFLQ